MLRTVWRISAAATRTHAPPEPDAAGEIRQGRGIGYPGAEPPRGTRGKNTVRCHGSSPATEQTPLLLSDLRRPSPLEPHPRARSTPAEPAPETHLQKLPSRWPGVWPSCARPVRKMPAQTGATVFGPDVTTGRDDDGAGRDR